MICRSSALLRVSSVALIAALTPIAAQAQTGVQSGASADDCRADPTQPSGATNVIPGCASEPRGSGGEIVVTGSRIRLPNLQSLEPTLTVSREYFEDRNLTNVADALNETPTFRGSVTPNGAQGSYGQGVNFVNNFGLGSNRTLTLVNGRRFVTSNVTTLFNQGSAGSQVDLNVIPTILVSRVDTVDIGGAPVYGSDAISGVVNIILRDRFTGVEATALSGITEEGDGFRYNGSLLIGHDYFDGRANLTVSYSRDVQDGVTYNSRDFLRANYINVTNPSTTQAAGLGRPAGTTFANDGRLNPNIGFNDTASDGFPGSVAIRNGTIYYLNQGGLITSATGNGAAAYNYQFDTSGNLVPYNTGIRFVGINASGGDGFQFNDYSQITSQVKRDTLNAFAHFDVSDAFKLFFEGEYFHSRGDELVQQPTFNSNLFGGASGPLTFTNNSPFLTAQARAQLTALGITRFQISRASADLADLTGFSTTNLGRAVLGARGDFQIGSRNFNYEVSANYGRNIIRDTSQDVNRQNFINAVNVTTNAQGQVVCTATPAVQAAPGGTPIADPNCVPLNLLGFNQSSPEARAYIIAQNDTYSKLVQKVFNANVGGTPFSLFGNDQAFNVGYEHREEEGSFTPSAFQQQGLGRSSPVGALSGKYNVDEVFGEALLTLVSPVNDLKFLNRLEIFGRGRYVDNTVNGGFFSWAAGGRISPIRDITFRGNYTKSFRAPAITELFLPISPAFSSVPDLCSPGNINGGAAPATRNANCTAFLTAFPNATPLDAASATVPSLSGGNLGLQNEVARSYTFGVIIEPRFIPGLAVTADYLDIDISNPISSLTVTQIATACFDNPNFNAADPANGNAFCSRLQRYPSGTTRTAANGGNAAGQVVNDPANPGVTSGFINGNRVYFSGIQGTVNYSTSLTGLGIPGRFSTGTTLFYVRRRIVDNTGVAPVRTDGVVGDPKFQAQANLRYANETFGLSSSVNVVGQQIATRTGLSPDLREFNKYPAYATVNGSVFFNVDKQFRLNFSVTNIGNKRAFPYYGGYVPVTTNNVDLLGRRFVMSARINY